MPVVLPLCRRSPSSLQTRGAPPGADAHAGVSLPAGPRVPALQDASGPPAALHTGMYLTDRVGTSPLPQDSAKREIPENVLSTLKKTENVETLI